MALVAYSDESDLSENEDDQQDLINSKKVDVDTATFLHPKSLPQLKKKKTTSEIIANKDATLTSVADSSIEQKGYFSENIPEATDIVDDVPTVSTWNITKNIDKAEKPVSQSIILEDKKTKRNKVKLILPALSQFDDDEDDDEERQAKEDLGRKKAKPSSTGTGLFAVLPEPRGPTHLVPNHVARKKVKTSTPPIAKKKTNPEPVPQNDSDEEESVDFFFLPETSPMPPPLPMNPPVSAVVVSSVALINEPSPATSTESYLKASMAVTTPPYVSPHSSGLNPDNEYNGSSSTNNGISEFDQEALRRLAGRRNKGQVPTTLIDINADDALMSREEWVTRALCDEKPKKSFSRKKEGNPTQQQKRKHQITYLAHQAQEREQELQNAWGQNRFTKMQTQSKYGF